MKCINGSLFIMPYNRSLFIMPYNGSLFIMPYNGSLFILVEGYIIFIHCMYVCMYLCTYNSVNMHSRRAKLFSTGNMLVTLVVNNEFFR